MSVKPILFNTDMVKAILDGRKTVTRRVIKFKHPEAVGVSCLEDGSTGIRIGWAEVDENGAALVDLKTPYNTGDFLYVRETWAAWSKTEGIMPQIHYKADEEDLEGVKWKPSIHMPKEAARIWLKVTNIRVESLGYTIDTDWEKEGIPFIRPARDMWKKFCEVWDSTIPKGQRDKYGSNANPLVWVIEFERCEKPEESEET